MKFDFKRAALIEIDVQNDFCPGGALAVPHGDEAAGPLNILATAFAAKGGVVIATQDWHPKGHISFASSHAGKKPGDSIDTPQVKGQTLWPEHCLQGSAGADFIPALDLAPVRFIIRKGYRNELDSYSAFFENDHKTPTGLEGLLKGLGITTVVTGGLATDYCVFYSTYDAAKAGFKAFLAKDAARGIGFPEGSIEKAFKTLQETGVTLIDSKELL